MRKNSTRQRAATREGAVACGFFNNRATNSLALRHAGIFDYLPSPSPSASALECACAAALRWTESVGLLETDELLVDWVVLCVLAPVTP
jgi:hypothetical protein